MNNDDIGFWQGVLLAVLLGIVFYLALIILFTLDFA
jgi:hypothetical protein